MAPVGFLVELEALPGREEAIADFLAEARTLVDDEPGTLLWFAFRRGPSSFAIFDVFDSTEAREVHLHGEVRKAMEARGPALFSTHPVITPVDLVDAKVPSAVHLPN